MRWVTCTSLLLAVLLLVACEAPPPPIPNAWHQVDLVTTPESFASQELLRGEAVTLRFRAFRTLEMAPGQSAGWRLTLGENAFFSFRPVAEGHCTFRAFAQTVDGEEREELLQQGWKSTGMNLPRTVELSLAKWSGREMELRLRIADNGRCVKAAWATPVVLHQGPAPAPALKDGARPNILLIATDTLRADALGAYGFEPSVTPALDRLAAESDVFLNAFSTNNSTNPSFSSLMTGTWARDHQVYNQTTRLAPSAQTLTELLQESGYTTRGIVSARHLGRASGINQGFDEFVHAEGQFFAETVVHEVMDWAQEDTAEKAGENVPFFYFLHLFDAHVPHNPPNPYQLGLYTEEPPKLREPETWKAFREEGPLELASEERATLDGHTGLYPSEVAYLDWQLGRLLEFFRSRGLLENTVVVLVSDHGETLGERGHFFDHIGLYDITTRVPLMIRWPEAPVGRRIESLVQHNDLFPTLLGVAGLSSPWGDEPDLQALAERGRRAVFSEENNRDSVMVRTLEHKLVLLENGDRWLFDMRSDPGETENLAGTGLPVEAELAGLLERWAADRREMEAPKALKVSREEKENLEALGYLQP